MESKEQVFVRRKEEETKEEETELQAKKAPKKTEQVATPLDQIQQQAMMAYTAYIEAEQQVARAYKENEQQVEADQPLMIIERQASY